MFDSRKTGIDNTNTDVLIAYYIPYVRTNGRQLATSPRIRTAEGKQLDRPQHISHYFY